MVDFAAGTERIGEYWMNLNGETDDMFPSDGFGALTDDSSDNHLSDAIETVITRLVIADQGGVQANATLSDGDGNVLYTTTTQPGAVSLETLPLDAQLNINVPRSAAGFAIFSARCGGTGFNIRVHYHVLRRKPQTSPRSDVY